MLYSTLGISTAVMLAKGCVGRTVAAVHYALQCRGMLQNAKWLQNRKHLAESQNRQHRKNRKNRKNRKIAYSFENRDFNRIGSVQKNAKSQSQF